MQREGIVANEIGIFVRAPEQIDRAARAARAAGLKSARIEQSVEVPDGHVGIGTMHAAKGLEFRAVAVIACDDDVIPLDSRLMEIADESDLEDVYNTERHLLYVACTRARDHLLVTAVDAGLGVPGGSVAANRRAIERLNAPQRSSSDVPARDRASAPS